MVPQSRQPHAPRPTPRKETPPPEGFDPVLDRGRTRPLPSARVTPVAPAPASGAGWRRRLFRVLPAGWRRGGGPPPVLFIAAGAATVLLLLSLAGVVATRLAARDQIYPKVFVAEQNLGGLTRAEARQRLVTNFAPTLDTPLLLTYGQRQWTPKRADLGITAEFDATVAEAFAVGRGGGALEQVFQGWQSRGGASTFVPLTVSVNQMRLDAYLDGLQAALGTPPVDATVTIKGSTVVVTPGAEGVRLDRDLVRQRVIADLAELNTTTLALPVTYAPPVVATEAANAARAKIEAWASAPLVLTHGEKQWEVGRDSILNAVRVGPGPEFAMRLEPSAFRPRIAAVANEIRQEPQNAVIGWDSALVVRKPAKVGQRLKVDDTLLQLGAWQGGERVIPLPVEVWQPRIPDDVSTLGIARRIAVGQSNFAGSDAARAKNVALAAGFLDDTVVAPGETFSFLDAIGEISEERGYKKGYVILAEETVAGVGGGVCQVSTTMFRAAVFSGLPIVERNPHAYIVRYYEQGGFPVGLDAAVFSPGVDFKFQNETGAYLLIKTAVDGAANLSISIYGPELGYDVDLSKPTITNKKDAPDDEYEIDPMLPPGTKKQVEYAKAGEDVSITRIVRKNGVEVRRGTFSSHYEAWSNKYLVSRDMAPGARGTDATRAPNIPAAARSTRVPATTGAAVAPTGVPANTSAPPAPAATRAPVMPVATAPAPTARPAAPVAPTTAPATVAPAPAATKAPAVAATPVPTRIPPAPPPTMPVASSPPAVTPRPTTTGARP